jgi:YqaJ-like viral recombinase domain
VSGIILDIEQRSPEWFAARCGKVTGTAASDMLAKIKTGEAAARRDLRTRLVVERLTGVSQDEDGFVSADMRRGMELEADALSAYMAHSGVWVDRVGFIQHETLPVGYSPDGVIADGEGLLELKVPKSATHLKYLRAGTLPAEYLPQVTHGLFVSGAAFCDFDSFDPRFPDPLRLFTVRVQRSELDLAAYETALTAFLAEVQTEYEAVRTLANLRGTLTEAVA